MTRMSATDTLWLDMETPQTPMTLGGVFLIDPRSGGPNARQPDQVFDYIEQRLHRVPLLRQKLVRSRTGLAEPLLVQDEDFDLAFHVRRLALSKPGNLEQLKNLVSRLISSSVDMARPPWELYVIEGLDEEPGIPPGAYAILTKFHHSVFDGGSVGAILWEFMQDHPDQKVDPAPREGQISSDDTTSDWLTLPMQAGLDQWMATIKGLNSVGQLVSTAAGRKMASPTVPEEDTAAGNALLAPATRLSAKVTANRVCDFVAVPMDELRDMRNALGKPKVNDLWLAIVAGGLRHYLLAHDSLPERPLMSLCPISVREGHPLDGGNYLSGMRVTLATDIADPIERLAAISRSSAAAKDLAKDLGTSFVENLLGLQPYFVRSQMAKVVATLPERFNLAMPSPANVIVSNAPPPKGGHYFAGGKALTTFAFGPLLEGCGVLHSITGFDFESTVAVTSCREILPDMEFYMDCIRRSVADLKAAGASARA